MPVMQKMAVRFNQQFGETEGTYGDAFAPGTSLVETMREKGIIDSQAEAEFWGAIPGGIQESFRALMHHNGQREGGPVSVTLAWFPGYDYEIQMIEAPGTPVSKGGITVLFRSRYPLDRHPADNKETTSKA
ncbi:MAG: hypothetical protein Q8Q52_06540 [Acidimicrobiia bacterium]|nr:hypothetical protein [Acidimicrobiia bacterium]